MNNTDLFSESHSATYCPEDNKLRLYVGRVPRDEYEALRKEGWTSTPKQSCDFVAVWTPDREDIALSYAGFIGDEDQDPGERAAERAERFSGYLGKRMAEAAGHADSYESGPSAFGFQSQERAERAAARHERIADRVVNQWEKAEYWQRRTEGVIAHALYKDLPGVRMGRIKTLEAEARKNLANRQKAHAESVLRHSVMTSVIEHAEGKREKLIAYPGYQYSVAYIRESDGTPQDAPFTPEQLRRLMVYTALSLYYAGKWSDLRNKVKSGDVSGEEAASLWLSENSHPGEFQPDDSRWYRHFQLRLTYENQMLAAQGGRLEQFEIVPGGKIGGKLILKVSKSTKTGRVTSVALLGPRVERWAYRVTNIPGTEFAEYKFDTERLSPDAYTPPTEESLAELKAFKASCKAATPKKDACPLINPSEGEAERLQAILNEREFEAHKESHLRRYGNDYADQFKPSTVCRMTQAEYSERSKGSYARYETRGLRAGAFLARNNNGMHSGSGRKYDERTGPDLCMIRIANCDGSTYGAKRVVFLTDKPSKPLPASVWEVREEVAA